MNDVVLYSGGIDSFLVHHYLNKKNIEHSLLYFNLQGKYSKNEMDLFNSGKFKKTIKHEVIISNCLNMGVLEHEDAFIPNRNILAAIMANSVTGFDNIWIGGTNSDRVNDNNQQLFKSLSDLMTSINPGKTIKIDSPFWGYHKADIAKDFVNTYGWKQYDTIDDAKRALINCTFSCYYPLQQARDLDVDYQFGIEPHFTAECMNCGACFRKCITLNACGIFVSMSKDAIELVDHYYEEARNYIIHNDDNDYMLPRMIATLAYVEKWKRYEGIA